MSEENWSEIMKYKIFKRVMDIVFSFIGIILCFPILLLFGILIKIESPGPVIFKQKRLGFAGVEFEILKLRSMYLDAEKHGVYERFGDNRVTRVGRFIRKYSIDELPQLINILRGEMSFIGPRPALTYHPWKVEEYSTFQARMFDVRPGITGLAQVNGRKSVEWTKRIEINVDYVNRLSLRLDTLILLQTLAIVVSAEGNINTIKTVEESN